MAIPPLVPTGFLPPGIHAASLREVTERFGAGSEARKRQCGLLREVVEAARPYPTIKRVLLWGSFVTAKAEPADLDYSIVVGVTHPQVRIAPPHRRFFVAADARRYYGVDRGYLVIHDYPVDRYVEWIDFLYHTRTGTLCGVVEISLCGEFSGETP